MKRLILWVPFALFALIAIIALIGIKWPDDRLHPSQMIGQPLPGFNLPAALPGRATIRRADYEAGSPRIINVFASWCVPCAAESPQLMQLAQSGVPIDAVAIRDRPEDVARFLARWGDPFRNIGLDANSSLQLAIGSAGVPETFVVDGRGIIRFQHIGPLNNDADVALLLQKYQEAQQ